MIDSILTSIKKLLGISEDYTHFDSDLIMHINSVLSILTQIGVGPSDGYSIENAGNKWSEFIEDTKLLEMVKSYMHLKVKLLFDPPLSSSVMESMNRMISEFEWRIQVVSDNIANQSTKEGSRDE